MQANKGHCRPTTGLWGPMKANAGQRWQTRASKSQRRPTKAKTGQQKPMQAHTNTRTSHYDLFVCWYMPWPPVLHPHHTTNESLWLVCAVYNLYYVNYCNVNKIYIYNDEDRFKDHIRPHKTDRRPHWTGPRRFGPVFKGFLNSEDRSRSRSNHLEVTRPDL